ncbi:MAG TPA: hypothetical protein VMV46_19285 [Thermoanaerobaculia bacterium]|nr:hypothetical protein [Thermoanaerobaculia bacterium]
MIGFDNFNPFDDPTLEERRSEMLGEHEGFEQVRGGLNDGAARNRAFGLLGAAPDTRVCHLAAQAGVRCSLEHPGPSTQR